MSHHVVALLDGAMLHVSMQPPQIRDFCCDFDFNAARKYVYFVWIFGMEGNDRIAGWLAGYGGFAMIQVLAFENALEIPAPANEKHFEHSYIHFMSVDGHQQLATRPRSECWKI